jgi:hypothetical protein
MFFEGFQCDNRGHQLHPVVGGQTIAFAECFFGRESVKSRHSRRALGYPGKSHR